jgi:hypothetical protein
MEETNLELPELKEMQSAQSEESPDGKNHYDE